MTDSRDEALKAAAEAILARVPEGYGMRRDEAKQYARAAVIAFLRKRADELYYEGLRARAAALRAEADRLERENG